MLHQEGKVIWNEKRLSALLQEFLDHVGACAQRVHGPSEIYEHPTARVTKFRGTFQIHMVHVSKGFPTGAMLSNRIFPNDPRNPKIPLNGVMFTYDRMTAKQMAAYIVGFGHAHGFYFPNSLRIGEM